MNFEQILAEFPCKFRGDKMDRYGWVDCSLGRKGKGETIPIRDCKNCKKREEGKP